MKVIKNIWVVVLAMLVGHGTGYAQGFLHADTTYNTCIGVYMDDGDSTGNYSDNLNQTTTICSDTGNCVTLDFGVFKLDSGDNLIIFDGPDGTYPLVGAFTGSNNPGSITSSTGCLTLWFVSDTAGTDSGWIAAIHCIGCGQQGPCLPNMGDCLDTTCLDSFYDSGGPLGAYNNTENFIHTICSDSGNCVKVDFASFAVEAFFDVLNVYDGPTTGSPFIGQLTGFTNPGTIASTTGCLTFEFISDNNITSAGWAAGVSCDTCPGGGCLPVMGNCTDYSCSGAFYDPGGSGNDYGNNQDVIQTICSPFGNCIELMFNSFDLDTVGDMLIIHGGADTNAPVIGVFDGNNVPGTVTSPTGCLTIRLITDSTVTKAGWDATISCVTCGSGCLPLINNCTDSTCLSNYYDSGGQGGNYGNNENYVHTICSDSGDCAMIAFTDFELEDGFDFLKIYDGSSTSDPLFGNFTGTSGPDTLISTNGCLTFEFTSDNSLNHLGWKATILCDTCPPPCPIPVVGFKPTFNQNTVSFADTSTFSGSASFHWDFGDNTNSNMQSPMHTYQNDGYYQVCLTLQDSCYLDSVCQIIIVGCPKPIANFSTVSNLFQVLFTETGYEQSGAIFQWDFGDGSPNGTGSSPVHTYSSGGSYTICLTVFDTCGADTICKTISVNCPAPSANFSFTSNDLNVTFTDQSTGAGIQTWTWFFGDGKSSNLQNPTHSYGFGGTYLACLVVTDSCASDTACKSVTTSCDPPNSGFSFTTNSLTAFFTDTSSGKGIIFWSWAFGDGSASNSPSPTHIYTSPGTYYVCLTVLDSCGQDSFCRNVFVSGCPNPVAGFSHTVNYLDFTGTDASFPTGQATYTWDFGDGNTDTAKDAQHTYGAKGTYTVCHSVSDSCGSSQACKTIVVDSTIDRQPSMSDFQVQLYPNPTSGNINFVLLGGEAGNALIRVFDVLGRNLLKMDVFHDGETRLSSDFGENKGVLTLEIQLGTGKIQRQFLVIK